VSTVRIITAITLLLGSTGAAYAQNCCLPNVGDDPLAGNLITGIQWATILLIAVPYFLIGAFALWFYLRLRKPSLPQAPHQ